MQATPQQAQQAPMPMMQEKKSLTTLKFEITAATEYFHNISSNCFEKCYNSFHDVDLHVGEMACVDRCVVKFMQAQSEVGKIIVKNNEKMQAQMQAQQ